MARVLTKEFLEKYSHYLFHKKRYTFSQKVSKIFIPFFNVLTVRSEGYDWSNVLFSDEAYFWAWVPIKRALLAAGRRFLQQVLNTP